MKPSTKRNISTAPVPHARPRRRAGTRGIYRSRQSTSRGTYHLHEYERPVKHRWPDGDAGASADLTTGGHGRGLPETKGDAIVRMTTSGRRGRFRRNHCLFYGAANLKHDGCRIVPIDPGTMAWGGKSPTCIIHEAIHPIVHARSNHHTQLAGLSYDDMSFDELGFDEMSFDEISRSHNS